MPVQELSRESENESWMPFYSQIAKPLLTEFLWSFMTQTNVANVKENYSLRVNYEQLREIVSSISG